MTDETLSVWFTGLVASRLDYYTYSIMANVQLEHNQLPTANQLLMIGFQVNAKKIFIARIAEQNEIDLTQLT